MTQKKITLPEGWEVDKVEGNEIILKKSKKELPKTWEECYKQLGVGEYISSVCSICDIVLTSPCKERRNILPIGLGKPMLALMQLLICRQVYWQGFKPNWKDDSYKYIIEYSFNDLQKNFYCNKSSVLSFQSEEVRDKFFNNFRDLIEEAKELI